MTEARLAALFQRCLHDVQRVCGPLSITLCFGDASFFPKPRNYAFFMPRAAPIRGVAPDQAVIVFAPKVLDASEDRATALLLHEFGHAMDILAPPEALQDLLPADRRRDPVCSQQGTERRADALAEGLWGVRLYYDGDTVQTLCCGTRPRPARLGL